MSRYDKIILMRGEAASCANHYKQDAERMDGKAAYSDEHLIEVLYDWVPLYQKRPYKKLANGTSVRNHRQLLLNIAELMKPVECEMHIIESRGKKVIKCSACDKTIKPPAIEAIPKDSREIYHTEFAMTAQRWLHYCPWCGSEVIGNIRWDVE